ncbi:hypothetical protein ALC53_05420 [Atta colombica]|uniref:Uncharacterized protein n=1 Tax=Atta colombica TaxID=520822 RepID=A0A195BIZ2_9HYME|nr:hypothetical protein ALC53_05420 [Atta colombica]
MKLFALILVLSCVIAYTVAQNREWLINTKMIEGSHQLHFGVNPRTFNPKDVPLFLFDANGNLRFTLFGANANQTFSSSSNVLEKRSS